MLPFRVVISWNEFRRTLGGKDRADLRLRAWTMIEGHGLAGGVAGGIARTSSALRWRLLRDLVAEEIVGVGRSGWLVNPGTSLNSNRRWADT